MQNLKKLSFLLSNEERFRAILLLGMTLIMALIEMIGVASILPFIGLLSNPQIIETNAILSTVYQTVKNFGIETKQQFLIATGIFCFLLLIFVSRKNLLSSVNLPESISKTCPPTTMPTSYEAISKKFGFSQ